MVRLATRQPEARRATVSSLNTACSKLTPLRLVYNVEEFDYNGFVSAIKTAMVTPIEPYVFPRMTRAAMDERIRAWLEADWESEAKYILAQRKAGHETQKGDWVEMFDL